MEIHISRSWFEKVTVIASKWPSGFQSDFIVSCGTFLLVMWTTGPACTLLLMYEVIALWLESSYHFCFPINMEMKPTLFGSKLGRPAPASSKSCDVPPPLTEPHFRAQTPGRRTLTAKSVTSANRHTLGFPGLLPIDACCIRKCTKLMIFWWQLHLQDPKSTLVYPWLGCQHSSALTPFSCSNHLWVEGGSELLTASGRPQETGPKP